ncbi:DNA methyltransferase [Flagellimonas flava]|uniref:DNA methyltransferase n=1 Tax=Flagellimonas flava TaxID=570519 RepID=UPI003D661C1F
MTDQINDFVQYASRLDGDEKGEAQVFCDRLFQAFGHDGYKEAGATLEFRVKSKKKTNFADLLWGERVLIEMKKKGAQLPSHRTQIFDYWWKLRPNQPKYSILCNFDEFIIYDFALQDEPLDRIRLEELADRYTAFNFMLPKATTPIFENNLEEATRETADSVAKVFNSILERGVERERAQRFILQSVFTMFAEDYQLLPKDIFTKILLDSHQGRGNPYDLIGGLFNQMNSREPARGGRFKEVPYFNGGLFAAPEPIELTDAEVKMLLNASSKLWNKVNPAIFGTIFQSSMGEKARHAFGAHFTTELDILKIVHPTIIQPWREKITKARTLKDMKQLRRELAVFKVLDPACGSGNFLYVAFRELKRIEMELLNKIHTEFPKSAAEIGTQSIVSIKQFHGMDYNQFAVELAKVTLMLAKEIAIKETRDWVDTIQTGIPFIMEDTLPLDNMDKNILFADALFTEWIEADVIIGNPPYQSKNKMQEEYGIEYLNKLWNAYPDVPGRADYCVYWFYKAHQNIKKGGFAGLVGTNTIRENYSREGSLDYILDNGGTIFNAISSQPWSGDAAVSVSIVNWTKGKYNKAKFLYIANRNGEFDEFKLDEINSSLKVSTDVSKAKILKCNKQPKSVFQGQTHGHKGFLLSIEEGQDLIRRNNKNSDVVKPFLIGDVLVSQINSQPDRYVIDFTSMDIMEAASYQEPYEVLKQSVLPDREKKALNQEAKNKAALEKNPNTKVNKHHINFYKNWWKLSYGREDMLEAISELQRVIVVPRVSKRPTFEFCSTEISPNDALMVFAFEDDYMFGIVQSSIHWEWWKAKCSTLEERLRYTTNTVWDTFPFPQTPRLADVKKVAVAAKELRDKRNEIINKHNYTLRDIYRILEEPGANPLKDAHRKLDDAVLNAYGFSKRKDLLTQLLQLNFEVADTIEKGEEVQGPGLPNCVKSKKEFVSDDCVKIELNK